MEQVTNYTRSMSTAIIQTSAFSATTVLSVGNLLVCIALYRNRRLRTITNFYVLSLAVVDIVMAILNLPFQVIASGLGRWPFGYNLCQFSGFLTHYWAQLSLCILALASINRYVCVVKSHKYPVLFTKRRTIRSIIGLCIASFVQILIVKFTLPVIYQWHAYSLYCQATVLDEGRERRLFVSYGCFFVFLMLLVVFCYGSIYRVVRAHNSVVVPSFQQVASCAETRRAQEIKNSGVIFAAVLGFAVCWTPLIVMLFLIFGFQVSIPASAHCIYPILSPFSTWVNPIIYGVLNRAMRKEFRKILFCRKNRILKETNGFIKKEQDSILSLKRNPLS